MLVVSASEQLCTRCSVSSNTLPYHVLQNEDSCPLSKLHTGVIIYLGRAIVAADSWHMLCENLACATDHDQEQVTYSWQRIGSTSLQQLHVFNDMLPQKQTFLSTNASRQKELFKELQQHSSEEFVTCLPLWLPTTSPCANNLLSGTEIDGPVQWEGLQRVAVKWVMFNFIPTKQTIPTS